MRSPLWEQQRKQAVERPATPWAVTQCSQASTLSATIWAFVPDHTSAFFFFFWAKLAQWTYPHGSSHPWLPWQSPFLAPLPSSVLLLHHAASSLTLKDRPFPQEMCPAERTRAWLTLRDICYAYCRSQAVGGLCPWTLTPWEYTITAEGSSCWSHTARSISPSPTWLQVQLEEEFQLVGERSTVQSICKRGILRQWWG